MMLSGDGVILDSCAMEIEHKVKSKNKKHTKKTGTNFCFIIAALIQRNCGGFSLRFRFDPLLHFLVIHVVYIGQVFWGSPSTKGDFDRHQSPHHQLIRFDINIKRL